MEEAIRFSLDYLEKLNYAVYDSSRQVIRRMHIENHGSEDILDAELSVTALPEFMAPWRVPIPRLPAGKSVDLGQVPSELSTEFILSLTEAMKGELKLCLNWAEGEVQSGLPLEILPFDSWSGAGDAPELLAAFATPNHPAVTNLMVRAGALLEELSGSGSFDGYGAKDPDRVLTQVSAIYSAVAELGLDYSPSPAGLAREGQRIRLADAITEKGQGNCLDLSLLFASLLEAVGLNPILLIFEDHCLPGLWLTPEVFPETVNYDGTALSRRAASGMERIALFESAMVTKGRQADFNQARDTAGRLIEDAEGFFCSVDVRRARSLGIRPLPVRVLEQGRYVLAAEGTLLPGKAVAPREVVRVGEEMPEESQKLPKQKVWERKLLDLSLRNSLLNYRAERGGIPLVVPDLSQFAGDLNGEEVFTIFPKPPEWDKASLEEAGSGRREALRFRSLAEPEYASGRIRALLDEAGLEERGLKLVKGATAALEETGASSLYLALGLLSWYSKDDPATQRFAPLVLIPVEAQQRGHLAGLTLNSREEEGHFNITLQEMLKNDFGIQLSGLDPLPQSGNGVDLIQVFSRVRSAILREKQWDVLEEAHLGLFSFSKFILWNDLSKNLEEFRKNPIVDSLMAGRLTFAAEPEALQGEFLDDEPRNQRAIYPVSCDASQSMAVLDSLAGKSFVLHGPPGTGKSQTITNIIANALLQNKRVLFVAQKMAALEVVEKRLNQIGIASFCLELHSNKARKKMVLDQLEQSMKIQRIAKNKDFETEKAATQLKKDELNAVVKRLYAVDASGYSLYDLITGNSQLQEFTKYIDLPKDFQATDLKAKEAALDKLARLGAHAGGPYGHPLRGIGAVSFRPALREEIAQAKTIPFPALGQSLAALIPEGGTMAPQTFPQLETLLADLNSLRRVLRRNPALKTLEALQEAMQKLRSSRGELAKLLAERERILADFLPEVLAEDPRAMERSFKKFEAQSVLGKIFRKNPVETQLGFYARGGAVDKTRIPAYLSQLAAYALEKSSLEEKLKGLYGLLPPVATESGTLQEMDARLVELEDIAKRAGNGEYYQGLFAVASAEGFDQRLAELEALLLGEREKLTSFLQATAFEEKELLGKEGNYFQRLGDKVEEILPSLDLLRDWLIYKEAEQEAARLGLKEMAAYYDEGHASDGELLPAFQKSVLRQELKRRLEGEDLLLNTTGHSLDEQVASLKEALQRLEILERKELYHHLATQVPNMVLEKETSREIAVLQRALRSGARSLSIRGLFAETDQLLRRIAPCMLMSPMSVAQYLKPEASLFDLVVFDEASQIPTAEAIGSLGRAKEAIIVGDPKQLPPTSFFMAQSNEDTGGELDDLDNILEDSLALSLPESYLLWHYRSRHESLIAFSNRNFYDGSLYTYPSPDDLVSKVSLKLTGGVYERGGARVNRTEAEAVAEEVARRLADPQRKGQSLGIVTFSVVQQELIEKLIQERVAADQALEQALQELPEPLFVKNLENVQGDERDVIIFSIGYGPDENGRLTMNFGPINQEGGWRRLNVAVTRSRLEMMVFTNIDPARFHVSGAQPRGVRDLKAFLDFASRGSRTLTLEDLRRDEATQNLNGLIAEKLRERGWRVETAIGTSRFKVDLGIVDPSDANRFILGVLCGGASYKEAKTAYDREILQPSVLKGLGWQVMRVYAVDWLENEDRVAQAIEDRLKEILSGSQNQAAAPLSQAEAGAALESEEFREIPYVRHQVPGRPLTLDEFLKVSNAAALAEELMAIIQAEGPISLSLLTKRAVALYELPRATDRLKSQVEQILNKIRPKTSKPALEIIYWPNDQAPDELQRWRRSLAQDEDRLLTDIAPEEVMACLQALAAQPIAQRSLIREASTALGYPRLNIDNEKFLQDCLDLARLQGRLKQSDEGLCVRAQAQV